MAKHYIRTAPYGTSNEVRYYYETSRPPNATTYTCEIDVYDSSARGEVRTLSGAGWNQEGAFACLRAVIAIHRGQAKEGAA